MAISYLLSMQIWRKIGIWLLLFGSVKGNVAPEPRTCFIPSCTVNGCQVVCENLSELPHCFPKNTETLIIRNSPDFTELPKGAFDDISDTLRELLIQQTDLKTLEKGSLRLLRRLETFEVSSSEHLLKLEPSTLFSDLKSLETLNFSNCPNLESLSPNIFEGLDTVKNLILNKCDLQNLRSDSFAGLPNLQTLDLEDNFHLESIPRNALSKMRNLTNFYFSSCDMSILYPEYFDSAFKEGNLKRVVGKENQWDCQTMCDFVGWLDENPGFKSIADLGYCTTPSYVENFEVLNLDDTTICNQSTSVFLTFTVTLCIMTFMLLLCFCLVMKNCCFGLCNSSSTVSCPRGIFSRSRCRRRDSRVGDNNNDSHHLQTISELTVEGEEEPGTYPEWNINDIDPPSYSTLQPKTSEHEFEIDLEDTDSMEGIPPPAYTENLTE